MVELTPSDYENSPSHIGVEHDGEGLGCLVWTQELCLADGADGGNPVSTVLFPLPPLGRQHGLR